jgi:hypothetical protein
MQFKTKLAVILATLITGVSSAQTIDIVKSIKFPLKRLPFDNSPIVPPPNNVGTAFIYMGPVTLNTEDIVSISFFATRTSAGSLYNAESKIVIPLDASVGCRLGSFQISTESYGKSARAYLECPEAMVQAAAVMGYSPVADVSAEAFVTVQYRSSFVLPTVKSPGHKQR